MDINVFDSLWIEKYRPHSLEDIVLNDETLTQIKKYINQGIIPNLFLCSAPGQGKTSLAKMLAADIFKVDYLYINCSDENNVDTVRNKVAGFANTLSFDNRFKIIILDEADGFANVQAQKILRGLMEETADNTRFIFTANYKGRIIDALRSRCDELDITPTKQGVAKRVLQILKAENVSVPNEQTGLLFDMIERFFPDVRSIVKILQRSVDENNELKLKNYAVESGFLNQIIDYIIQNKPTELRKYVIENESVFNSDYPNLICELYDVIVKSDNINGVQKAKWTICLGDYLAKFPAVVDPEINTFACLYSMMSL